MRSILDALAQAGDGRGRSYAALAQQAYGTSEPTAAELSAVRRSVSRLAAHGVVRRLRAADGTLHIAMRRPMSELQFQNRVLEVLDAQPPEQVLTLAEILSMGFGIDNPTATQELRLRQAVTRLRELDMVRWVQMGRSNEFAVQLEPWWRSERLS